MSLKKKAMHGVFWRLCQQSSVQVSKLIISMILARLITPEEFGIVGMLMVFTALGRVFNDAGFGLALIQREHLTQDDICSVFYFNILMGASLTTLFYFCAPWIADFYKLPELKFIARVSGFTFLISSFGSVHSTLMEKSIDYKTLMKISLGASITSGVFGVFFAMHGFGVWALVYMSLIGGVMSCLLSWVFSPWRPTLRFSVQSLGSMFHFGSRVMVTSLVDTGFQQLNSLVIARVYSAADLGFVTRAKRLQQLSLQTILMSINSVLLPIFSTTQGDKERFHRGLKKTITMLAAINFPLFSGLAIISRSLIWIMFGEQWLPAAPYFSILCMSAFLVVIGSVNRSALLAVGESAKVLKISIVSKVSVIIGLLLSYRFGVMAILLSTMICIGVNMFLNAWYAKRLFNYSIFMQLRDTLPFVVSSAGMVGCVWWIGENITNPFVGLPVQAGCGGIVYLLILYIFFRGNFLDVAEMVSEVLPESAQVKFLKVFNRTK